MKKQLLTLTILLLSFTAVAQDYSVPLDVEHWNSAFTGPVTEFASSIRCSTVGYRNQSEFQTKHIFDLADRDVYIKWKKNNYNNFMRGSVGIAYTNAKERYAASSSYGHVYPNDTWLYTHIKVNSVDKSYSVVTSTANYDNAGGTVANSTSGVIPDNRWNRIQMGSLNLGMADTKNASAYIEVGELKITNDIPAAPEAPFVMETDAVYDFSDGNIPSNFTINGNWSIDTLESPNGNSMYIYGNLNDSVSVSVTNACAVIVKYKEDYQGGGSAVTAGNTQRLYAYQNGDIYMGFVVYSGGTTAYASDWREMIFPVDVSGTVNFTFKFLLYNGQKLWIDEIRVLKSKGSNTAPSDISLSNLSINENSAVGTSVANITVTDADANDKPALQLVSGTGSEDNSFFRFNGDKLILLKSPDYETNSELHVRIKATDESLESIEESFIISVNDVNEAPVAEDGQVFDINENSSYTVLGTVQAEDEDSNSTLYFSILSSDYEGAFTINHTSGNIIFDPQEDCVEIDPETGEIDCSNLYDLNFEFTSQYTLEIRVYDNGDLSDTTFVIIDINDVNETPVIGNGQVFDIDENSTVNASAGTVFAIDEDAGTTLAYSIESGNDAGMFAIDASTGEITAVSSALDFESTSSYSLGVKVSDGSLSDTKTVTININDVNEAPVITDSQVFDIDENSATGTVVGTVLASDEDAGTTLEYSILLGPGYNGGFNINSSTGEITSDMELDFETTEHYIFTVRVSDGSLTYDNDIRINVNNVNEAPVIVSGQTFNINENSSTGTAVGIVSASDVDAGTILKYSIESGNDAGRFAINTSTGEIIAASDALDFEATNSYTLDIEVSDETLNDVKSITININNVNDNTPVVESAEITIDEGTANGTVIYTLVMSDADGDLNPLTFTSTAGHDALNLVGDDIVVVDATKLDYETDQTITFKGYVSDGTLNGYATITINLNNLNDNTPVMANLNLSVRERQSNGMVLATFAATDADGSLNHITYSFVTGEGHPAFTITGDELIVTDGGLLDFETEPSITMQVEISDGTHTSTADINITVTDVADDAPSITAQPQSVEVCYGEQAILNVTAEGDGTLTYDWLSNGISLGKPDNATLTLEVGEADETAIYSCKVASEFGEAVTQTVTAKMRDMLTVDLGDDVTISTSESVTLDAGVGYSNYQWSDNSGAQTLLVEGSVYGKGTHFISVEVTDDFGCPVSDEVIVEVTVATDINETTISDVKIYPNPASDYVFAQATGISETLTIEFINMAGQRVLVKQLSGLQSAEKIDLTGLKNGMYIVKIYNHNYQKTERIIIR